MTTLKVLLRRLNRDVVDPRLDWTFRSEAYVEESVCAAIERHDQFLPHANLTKIDFLLELIPSPRATNAQKRAR